MQNSSCDLSTPFVMIFWATICPQKAIIQVFPVYVLVYRGICAPLIAVFFNPGSNIL